MRAIRRIMLAVADPQDPPSAAMRKAVQLAQALHARIELFHAIARPLYTDPYIAGSCTALPHLEQEIRQRILTRLETVASRMRRHHVKVSVAAEWDHPAYEAIVRHSQSSRSDLIVAQRYAGSHRGAGLLRLTDWELLRLSPIPVLLVRNPRRWNRPAILTAVDPSHAFAKPAGLDTQLLRLGSTLTHALRGTHHAVHSYIPLPLVMLANQTISADTAERLERDAASAARRGFERVLRNSRIPQKRRHLVPQHPLEAIERTARETRSSILIMGAVSRSGLRGLMIGNTAEALLDRVSCDILVVKPARFRSRVPRAGRGTRLVAVAASPAPF